MKGKELVWKSVGIAALSLALTGQAVLSYTKSSKEKLKSSTGIVTSMEEGKLFLDLGKKGGKVFIVNNITQIILEKTFEKNQLNLQDVVRISGKGSKNSIEVSRISRLNQDLLKISSKKKGENAFSDTPKKTEIKAQITSLDPLLVSNRYNQSIRVMLDDKSEVRNEVYGNIRDLNVGEKVRVSYRMSNSDCVAESIFVPVTNLKQVKK